VSAADRVADALSALRDAEWVVGMIRPDTSHPDAASIAQAAAIAMARAQLHASLALVDAVRSLEQAVGAPRQQVEMNVTAPNWQDLTSEQVARLQEQLDRHARMRGLR
jgi:hypothetical protein